MTEATQSPPCPNHYCHIYTFDEVKLGSGSNEQPYFRALLFFSKQPGLSDEFFHDHWKSVHADLTMQTNDIGVNLLRYTQLHMDQNARDNIKPLLQAARGTMQPVVWDGCAEFHAKSADHFTRFMMDVYTSKKLDGCGKRFADLQQGYHIMCGYENLILGSAIPVIGGQDGVNLDDERLSGVEKGEEVNHTKTEAETKAV